MTPLRAVGSERAEIGRTSRRVKQGNERINRDLWLTGDRDFNYARPHSALGIARRQKWQPYGRQNDQPWWPALRPNDLECHPREAAQEIATSAKAARDPDRQLPEG